MPVPRKPIHPGGVADIEVRQRYGAGLAGHRHVARPVLVGQPPVERGAREHVCRPQLDRRILRVIHYPRIAQIMLARMAHRRIAVLVGALEHPLVCFLFRHRFFRRFAWMAIAVRVLQVIRPQYTDHRAVYFGAVEYMAHLRYPRQNIIAWVEFGIDDLVEFSVARFMRTIRYGRLKH